MALWEFVLLYLAGFALLHLVVYRFLRRRSGESSIPRNDTPRTNPGGVPAATREPAEAGPESDIARRCPHCGTPNQPDPSYTFCRHCASSLRG